MVVKKINKKKAMEGYKKFSNCIMFTYQSPEVLSVLSSPIYTIRTRKRLVFYSVEKEGQILLIAPFRKVSKNKLSLLGGIENMHIADFVYDSNNNRKDLYDAFISLINKLREDGFKTIEWRYLREESVFFDLIFNDNQVVYSQNWEIESVAIHYERATYDEYYKNLSKNTRQNIRTARNRIKKDNYELRTNILFDASKKEKKQTHYKYSRVYLKRQSSKYNTPLIIIMFKSFFNYFSKSQDSETAFFADIQINNEIAACMEGFYSKVCNSILVPKLSINDKYSHYSPGILLIDEVSKELYKLNINTLDLLIGTERYKFVMGGTLYKSYSVDISI